MTILQEAVLGSGTMVRWFRTPSRSSVPLRSLAAQVAGLEPEQIVLGRSGLGQRHVASPRGARSVGLSVSRAAGWTCLAAGYGRVGADAVSTRDICAPGWTCTSWASLEALVKAEGVGLIGITWTDLCALRDPRVLSHEASRRGLVLTELQAPTGLVACVASERGGGR